MQIELQGIGKRYLREWIFRNINYTILSQSKLALLGANGSGKSTLLQVISGHIIPSQGKIIASIQDKKIESENLFQHIGYTAPAMYLPELFTIKEFLTYHFKHKCAQLSVDETIDYIGLGHASDKRLEQCSSGMRQRVKLAQAMLTNAPLLLLDEPTVNLDVAGVDLYKKMIAEFAMDKTVIVSSNDAKEYEFCTTTINVLDFK
jgi:ABC-type multidrug transport system ATPase subunit